MFKGAYGPTKLRYPLFGKDAAEEFDTIVLRGGANDGYSWSGNEQNATFTAGPVHARPPAGHGQRLPARHVRAPLRQRPVLGTLQSRASDRTGPSPASYYGGEKEDWDVFKHKSFTLDQGDRTALNQMLSQCQAGGHVLRGPTRDSRARTSTARPGPTIRASWTCPITWTT